MSVLSLCDVGLLWPNGWTDQDETWRAGLQVGLGPRPHCVGWGPRPPQKEAPNVWPMSIVAKTVGYIRSPLGTEVGLGPGDIVLDGDPVPPKSGTSLPIFGPWILWPNGWMD